MNLETKKSVDQLSIADTEDETPDVLLLGTGSEVQLYLDAYEQLKSEEIKARVVSMPSWEFFEQQSREYRESVISPDVTARLGGAGFHDWLGEVRRVGWVDDRHEDLRVFGAAKGSAREVRLYPPGRGARGEGAARQVRVERMRRCRP